MKGAPDSNEHVLVEGAVERVDAVARALTSTTGGIAALQREVVCTAASIAGDGASAAMALRDGEDLSIQAIDPHRAGLDAFAGWTELPEVRTGQRVKRVGPRRGIAAGAADVLPGRCGGGAGGDVAIGRDAAR